MISIGTSKAGMQTINAHIHYKDLERSFEKLSNPKSGRTQDGAMHNFLIGVYYNYKMTVMRDTTCTNAEWDNLWDIVSQKAPEYYIKVPYNQGSLTFKAYITKGSQKCKRIKKSGTKNIKWDSLQLEFIACLPCGSKGISDTNGNYVYTAGDIT